MLKTMSGVLAALLLGAASQARAADYTLAFTGVLGAGAPTTGADATGEPATLTFTFDPATMTESTYNDGDRTSTVFSTPNPTSITDQYLKVAISYAGQAPTKPTMNTQGYVQVDTIDGKAVAYQAHLFQYFDYGVGRDEYTESVDVVDDLLTGRSDAYVDDRYFMQMYVVDQYHVSDLTVSTDIPIGMSAAPEPSTWVLMFAGVALAGVALRSKGAARTRGRMGGDTFSA